MKSFYYFGKGAHYILNPTSFQEVPWSRTSFLRIWLFFQIVNKWRPKKIFHRVCSSCCWTLSWAICIQPTPSHFHFKIQFIINLLLIPTGSILFSLQEDFMLKFCTYLILRACYRSMRVYILFILSPWSYLLMSVIYEAPNCLFSSFFYFCAFFPNILLRNFFSHCATLRFLSTRNQRVLSQTKQQAALQLSVPCAEVQVFRDKR